MIGQLAPPTDGASNLGARDLLRPGFERGATSAWRLPPPRGARQPGRSLRGRTPGRRARESLRVRRRLFGARRGLRYASLYRPQIPRWRSCRVGRADVLAAPAASLESREPLHCRWASRSCAVAVGRALPLRRVGPSRPRRGEKARGCSCSSASPTAGSARRRPASAASLVGRGSLERRAAAASWLRTRSANCGSDAGRVLKNRPCRRRQVDFVGCHATGMPTGRPGRGREPEGC